MASFPEYFRGYVEHSKWANRMLMQSMDAVEDDKYYAQILPGCRSMHQILNHAIAMDELWIGEMKQQPVAITSGTQIVYEDRAALKAARLKVDDEICELVKSLDDQTLESEVEYPEKDLTWPMSVEFAHVFRHQVHHRGQLSILIAASGHEMPKLDQMFIPPRETGEAAVEQAAEQAPLTTAA